MRMAEAKRLIVLNKSVGVIWAKLGSLHIIDASRTKCDI
jgi:hypothetical protein